MSSPLQDVVVVSSSHELGGAEVYLLTLLEGLTDSLSIEVLVSDHAPAELSTRARAAGARVTTVPGLARRPSLPAIIRLARALSKRDPALVHVNLSDQGDGLTAIAAAALARVPVVATLHLVVPDRRPELEWLARWCLRMTREVVGVSDWVGRYLEGQGVNSCVVRNGVGTPRIRGDARAELGVQAGEVVVGGIGRLDPQKGWDVLCAAAPRVHARSPGTRFLVIGEGPERARLTGHLGGSDPGGSAVQFLGYRERGADLVSGIDVLAVPSRYEGFGLVAVEAMLAGVPVVASRVGSLPEVLGDTGVLVPPDDPEALADALISLVEHPARRAALGRRGAERARARFGSERMCQETLEAWQRAAHPAKTSRSGVRWSR